MQEFIVTYRIGMEGAVEAYELKLDPETMLPVDAPHSDQPEWTRLEHHQCANCPLDPGQHPRCPMAERLLPIVVTHGSMRSHTIVDLEVEASGRCIQQKASLQQALGSLMGLVIASCGCPHTDFLKPMARFHQPLSNAEETVYRASSMYLMSQYMRQKNGLSADFDLKHLNLHYKHLQLVNRAMADRLRSICTDDSAVNAVVLLDSFAKFQPLAADITLEKLEPLFKAYLRD
ncbi:MAG: DUF6901 family protein [Gammaproteobacteria bacterium]